MVSAELSVVTYAPRAHSMAHWAIYLRVVKGGQTKHLIYQANGNEGELHLDIREADPRASQRFSEQILVSEIDDGQAIAEVKQTLENQPMKNNVPTWNCQDWVMEALDDLDTEGLLDAYQYQEAKGKLEALYHN
ncbi:hypothetical protein EDD16DRAFT_26406 [Pisolithus croceorrhizus]|nr:hypothetical protein EDD16DRAFT_26406 [Pisolithus croceorrhizus]KAI6162396.1 hypothetical protein EDD17DRAFT_1695244 [Pisolithus thermaeus]